MSLNYTRYQRDAKIAMTKRSWPEAEITKAPIWCSVDLRDGNQALVEPMRVEEKLEFFRMLVKLGFKEIEIGFPSSSQIEYDFVRELITKDMIPDDVTIQALVMCKDDLIKRTYESLQGAKKAIVHIYNPTSVLQRDVVFNMSKDEIKKIAVDAAILSKKLADSFPGEIIHEYSPESFTGTELDYALEVCTAVQDVWQPTPEHPMILNLPATVEMNTPNVYADRIEWMSQHLKNRAGIILSIHPHNDRGTGVAICELGLMAGAERVEGTLFGNGERTGNVDILTVAYNMFSQGVDPVLQLDNVSEIRHVYERLSGLNVPERHPYAGQLVFTAFSGPHQDAINKGMKAMTERHSSIWQVPYLPVDPKDIGREYEALVRINSQSGKGGIAYVMETYYGYKLPKGMHKEFADIIQRISELEGEVEHDRIMAEFQKNYLDRKEPYHFRKCRMEDVPETEDVYHTIAEVVYTDHGVEKTFVSRGNGPIDAVQRGLVQELGKQIRVLDYSEHALREGSNAQAAAYMHVMDGVTGITTFGAGVSSNITRASIRAMFCAVNRIWGDE